jgi:hypothetical protein
MLGRRTLPARRLPRLGATPDFRHGLLCTTATILVDHAADDEQEGDQADRVNVRARFLSGAEETEERPRQREQPARGAKEREQAILALAPEAEEEERPAQAQAALTP